MLKNTANHSLKTDFSCVWFECSDSVNLLPAFCFPG